VIGLREALRLAANVQEVLGCPVHFHQLEAKSTSFFVFDATCNVTPPLLAGYGCCLDTRISTMCEGITVDEAPY
jgi:hypothetical protein